MNPPAAMGLRKARRSLLQRQSPGTRCGAADVGQSRRPSCRVTDHLSVCAGHRSASRRCIACQYNSVWAARCALRCAPMAARSLRHLTGDATPGAARAVGGADPSRGGTRGSLVSAIGHWSRPGPRYTLRLPATGSPASFAPHPFMAPTPPAQARTRFDLKSASLPVLAVVLKTTDAALLASELAGCVADAP